MGPSPLAPVPGGTHADLMPNDAWHDLERFGFGDFTFRMPDGTVVGKAEDLKSLRAMLETVPAECLAYHAGKNHFSNWFKSRTELALADRLRPRPLGEFGSTEALRAFVLQEIDEFRLEQHRTVIADFNAERFEPRVSITRIGTGSPR